MGNFEEKIALAVRKELLTPEFIARKGGRIFWVKPTTAGDYATFVAEHPAYSDGVAAVYTTVDAAVSVCTASEGDVVIVTEGHTEALASATALKLDIAGVRIIGQGVGNSRPTITLNTATTTTVPVSAASVSVENIIFTANFADIVSVFTLTTANNFKIDGCSFKATAVDMNFLYIVDTDATTSNADGLTIINSKWIEVDTADKSMVKMDGDNYDVTISNNFVQLGAANNTASLMAIITGKSVFNAQIIGNRVFRLNTDTATGAILVTTDQADNSGVIADNFVQHADTAGELLITASSGFGTFNNLASGVAGASGYVLPAIDA